MLPRRSSFSPLPYSLWVCKHICYWFDGPGEPSAAGLQHIILLSLQASPSCPLPEITACSLLFKVSHRREQGGPKDVSIALHCGDQSGLFLQPRGPRTLPESRSETLAAQDVVTRMISDSVILWTRRVQRETPAEREALNLFGGGSEGNMERAKADM